MTRRKEGREAERHREYDRNGTSRGPPMCAHGSARPLRQGPTSAKPYGTSSNPRSPTLSENRCYRRSEAPGRDQEEFFGEARLRDGEWASSLGKGLTASSLGRLLKSRGLRVTMQKLDPYINVDPGTMNPFQPVRCSSPTTRARPTSISVHYERFVDVALTRRSNATTGSIYQIGARQGAQGRLPG